MHKITTHIFKVLCLALLISCCSTTGATSIAARSLRMVSQMRLPKVRKAWQWLKQQWLEFSWQERKERRKERQNLLKRLMPRNSRRC